jgi:hypothetical protein
MSSHREAPQVSKDPVADNTDVYAFVSPDAPDTVTLIANFIPLQVPSGGPNFYEFGDDVLYSINIDNDGDGAPDVSYQFRFTTTVRNPNTFLYNTGPILSLDSGNWNRRQMYSLTKVVESRGSTVLARNVLCPPCNIGPLSTPQYPQLAGGAVHQLGGGRQVFAGQRADGFYVDLGSIFDLGNLRPLQTLHEQYGLGVFSAPAPGVNGLQNFNVHTLALQVPITDLTVGGVRPRDPLAANAVIGVWATAGRRAALIRNGAAELEVGPYNQVSRLGNPLFNEVIVPMSAKDGWNAASPAQDSAYAKYVAKPELAQLLPALYPGVFPHLAALNASGKPRADLQAILLTGLPKGLIPGFQNYTGPRQADLLRLNVAVPPTANPNILGLMGGDPAGFPNGRRVADDVVTIELRAVAGKLYTLIDPTYQVDAAVDLVTDGLTPANSGVSFLSSFPYLGTPHSGYATAA